MLSKPFNLLLVYIVTIFNLAILASPILAAAFPFMAFKHHTLTVGYETIERIQIAISFLMFLVSFLMLFYLFLDFIFGFSVRVSLKNCTRYEKIKDYDFLTDIFDQVKNKFGEKAVKLYIKNSDEINAFAVSSVGSKAIVLTRGIINHYLVEFSDPKEFLYAIRSIVGHEMSHLVNKDFLPTFLVITNQKVTNLVSHILHFVFNIIANITSFMPYGGRMAQAAMWNLYSVLNFSLNLFNRLIVFNLYEFLRKFSSRSIEYRCDRQSAKAFGGKNMALALSKLGEGGYFTLFSTHPRTKSRIAKVQDIKLSDKIVRPTFVDSVSNYLALMLLLFTCLYFTKQAGVDMLIREYIRDHEAIHRKLVALWQLLRHVY